MGAGGSQAVRAVRAVLGGVWARKQTDREARRAGRHAAGCRGERAVCSELSRLALDGVHHLDDRRWRGDPESRANVDHLVVGPQGVFVVDAKNWAGTIEVRGGRVLQDGVPRDERLLALGWLVHRVQDALAAAGSAHRSRGLVCFASPQPALPAAVGSLLLTDLPRLVERLAAEPAVLTVEEVSDLTEQLAAEFPPYDVDPREVAEAEGLLFPDEETRHAGMRAALEGPTEHWATWLPPEQAAEVKRIFAGPARIRGSAGTGKTVVALHRVKWLAETRPGRFLVTSYVKTLPAVLKGMYERMSPETKDRVDFVGLHAMALRLLTDRGHRLKVTNGDLAFREAWRAHGAVLTASGLMEDYFREEISSVIKGRALVDLEAYLRLERVGRRVPLRAEVRRAVWALAQRYDEELAAAGQHDFMDVLRLARDEVRARPDDTWAGVVVDEVQDLAMVGLQLLHELAGRDRPDGLLLVGDGQQAVYPGGFRLSEAGVSVAGRAVVLRVNYRNTVEILAAARAVVAKDGYDDLDVTGEPGDRSVEVVRHGEVPCTGRYETQQLQDEALLWDLQGRLDSGCRPSDIGLLCITGSLAEEYAALLKRAGVPAVLMVGGPPTRDPGVQVGTWARSKGHEFRHVFLPQIDRRTRLLTGGGAQAEVEKAELLRRTLYVAMTRARDTLWTGQLVR